MAFSFSSALQSRQSANTTQVQSINTMQTPNRQGFPMEVKAFTERFGKPTRAIEHRRLATSDNKPLIGFEFSKPVVLGLEPQVFASKALVEAGFTYKDFADALLNGNDELNIVCHEGSNDIYISPKKAVTNTSDDAMAAMAMFAE